MPWTASSPPRRILAIRLRAFGDLAITLPYLRQVRDRLPDARIDLLTERDHADFTDRLSTFDHTLHVAGPRTERALVSLATLLPRLSAARYDVILDLQNDRISRTARHVLRPRAFVAFDRFSPRSAAERCRATLEASGLGPFEHRPGIGPVRERDAAGVLRDAGWSGGPLVQLNPASYAPARQWPDARWIELGEALAQQRPGPQLVIDGLPRIAPRALAIQRALGHRVVNIVGRTGKGEVLDVLRRVSLIVSEDSGLMHVAWVTGVPTIALFGGGPHVWTQPVGAHTRTLHGGNFPCAPCMAEHCKFGDTRCLAQHSVDDVLRLARELLDPD